jgi:lipoyl-dependent peroxiredoxin subunit C
MLTIGDKLPEFKLQAVIGNELDSAFTEVTDLSYEGKWKILFFYPKDFTFVCPTELVEFDNLNAEFEKKNTQLLGASIDSEFVHMAWRNDHPDLGKLSYPLLSDIKRELSEGLGILDANAGVSLRATLIIDPENIIQHVSVNNLNVGRNPQETLRLLDALQTGDLCSCSRPIGGDILKVA